MADGWRFVSGSVYGLRVNFEKMLFAWTNCHIGDPMWRIDDGTWFCINDYGITTIFSPTSNQCIEEEYCLYISELLEEHLLITKGYI